MKKTGGSGFALLLILCGALILFSKFSFGLGHIVGALAGYLIPIAMVALGYYSIKRGSGFIGWVILILGGLILMSKLSWLIGIVVAVALIGYGVSLLKKNRSSI